MIERFQKGARMAQAVAGATTIHIAGQVADDRKTGIETGAEIAIINFTFG